ncbi:MAG: hypothetical protein WCH21_11520, partial [Bacteroidota bacterium]
IQAASYEISGKPYSIDGAWLGADGENYLTGFTALIRDGVFSMERILKSEDSFFRKTGNLFTDKTNLVSVLFINLTEFNSSKLILLKLSSI